MLLMEIVMRNTIESGAMDMSRTRPKAQAAMTVKEGLLMK